MRRNGKETTIARTALRAGALAGASAFAIAGAALAQQEAASSGWRDLLNQIDPGLVALGGSISLAVAAIAWAARAVGSTRQQTARWSERLAEMEAQLEKSEAVLSAHPGLILVWEDDNEALDAGWGQPKILGGPAALASLMSFSKADAQPGAPVDQILNSLADLPVEDDAAPAETKKLHEKVRELRAHGIPFSGSIVTSEGRAIEADGRVAGGQVALWLTDPAVRMAEDTGIMGKVRERTTDLHGALAMLEKSPLPAWRRGADLALAWVNKAYADAVEAASPAAVIAQQIELDVAARKIAEKAASERRPADGRIIVNVNGERRVLRIVETPMHNAGDAALGGVAVDITELDRTRNELRQHIEANRRTLDQIPAAVALFNPNQTLAYHNRAFETLWGLDEADLAGAPGHEEILDRLRHDGKIPEQADYAEWKAEQFKLYTGDFSAPGAERDAAAPDDVWHLPDGRTLRVSQARHPLGGVLSVFEDITERLALETRYNTQINVQRATLDNLSEGVAVFSADGAMRLCNTAFRRMWRLDATLAEGRPNVDVVMRALIGQLAAKQTRDGEGLDEIKRRVTSLSPEDRTPVRDGALALADGRSLQYGTEPLPDGATLVHFLDVTDTKEREKELKERNAFLEDIDRQKSKFVDHISYQLRTPLATIIGFAEMLDNEMFGVLNDRQKDYAASIITASHHLRDLINDIIDLAVIDAGKMTIDIGELDVRDLLENAATYAALKAEDTQVSLVVDCAKDIGAIEADGKRLKQILFNLMSNAFAYTGAGGKVTLGADRTPGLVRIWVADTGRGVSPEDQAKAFDPFVSRGPSAGAGIGLSLVQRFVGLHGGWVRMESEPGAGTRVTCYLPEKAKTQDTPPPDGPGGDHPPADETAAEKPKRRRTTRKSAGGAQTRRRAAGGTRAQAAE